MPLQYRHVAFHLYLQTVYGKLVPNSTLSVNRSKPVQRTHGVALSLNKLVAFFWEASNEFTTLSSDPDFQAQKNTSWQTEVLIYLLRFSLPRRSSLEQILSHEDAFFRFLFSQADIECCVHIFWHQTFLFCPFLLSHFPTPTWVYLLLIYMSVTTLYGNKVLFFSQKQICTACTFGNIPPPCC